MAKPGHSNALMGETSPYLLQHAHNPVNWHPWNGEALETARRENKPILLSIGYSACHWCHVMAHESFEDEATAALMNAHFVNIKVDREERPDLDKIYQTAQQLLTRRTGGWPLTLFLTPEDQVPFFAGTYFPREPRYGLPGFKDILMRITELYNQDQDAIRRQNAALVDALRHDTRAPSTEEELTTRPLLTCIEELIQSFDPRYGGFGGAPKFPHPTNIERLLHHYVLQPYQEENDDTGGTALDMALLTLKQMANGGIYDHLGGGFCRYTVDQDWTIPHFEKMLYDNGPLLALYADAWRLTGDRSFETVARETADWIMRDMQSPEGGYYSSLDADSEGEEGRFYVWTREEVQSLLTAEEHDLFAAYYGLDRPANFEGKWHLRVDRDLDAIAADKSIDPVQAHTLIYNARKKLLERRSQRIWPGRDEKILTSWNALMMKGMAVASLRLGEPVWQASAERALAFTRDNLWKQNRLLATCKDGKAHINAYLDDHAFLIDAILAMLSNRWESSWLEFAVALADVMLERFYDGEGGGFFFTSHDHEKLLQRRKDFMDDFLPAGNGVAAGALIRLGHLIGNREYLEAAEQTLRAAWPGLHRYPHAHNALLTALEDRFFPPVQAIIRAPAAETAGWLEAARLFLNLRDHLYAIPDDAGDLPGLLRERAPRDEAVAYVCEGFVCLPPMTRDDFIHHLKQREPE